MSLLNTRMTNLRAKSPRLSDWTLLPSRYGALDAALNGNREPDSIVSQEMLTKIAGAVGRTIEIPVFDKQTVTISNTRSVTITDSENDSALVTVTLTTYAWGFTIAPALFMNNEVAMQEDFNRKFNKYAYAFLDALDTSVISALDTNRTQVFNDLLGIYSNTGNAVDVPSANRKEIFGDLNALQLANDISGPYVVIGNAGIQSLLGKLAELGIYNSENKTIQYADKDLRFTNNITNATGYIGTGYCLPTNALGMVFRHEREALLGTKLDDGTMWDMTNFPGTDIPLDVYFYKSVGDYNAMAGSATADWTRGAKEHWGFAIEAAVITPHITNLTTDESPIMKFALNSV